jgi:hypothetical protein
VTVTGAIESDERGKLLSEDREGSEKGERIERGVLIVTYRK